MTAPVRVDEIVDRWWSPRLGEPGRIVTDVADVAQCLSIIFNTPKGSDPHRPTFACETDELIDKPTNVIAERLPAVLIEAAELWEPRARIVGVPVTIDQAQVTYSVLWRLRDGGGLQQLTGVFGGGAR